MLLSRTRPSKHRNVLHVSRPLTTGQARESTRKQPLALVRRYDVLQKLGCNFPNLTALGDCGNSCSINHNPDYMRRHPHARMFENPPDRLIELHTTVAIRLGNVLGLGCGKQLHVVSGRINGIIGQAGADEQVNQMLTAIGLIHGLGRGRGIFSTLGPKLDVVTTGLIQKLIGRFEIISNR